MLFMTVVKTHHDAPELKHFCLVINEILDMTVSLSDVSMDVNSH